MKRKKDQKIITKRLKINRFGGIMSYIYLRAEEIMLWFGKKKNNSVDENLPQSENETVYDTAKKYDELVEVVSEEEILKALSESDDQIHESEEFDEDGELSTFGVDFEYEDGVSDDDDQESDDKDEEAEPEPEIQVTKIVTSFDDLCDYINSKPIGYVQYMRKENNEAFQLRDYHLRLARVWGSNSMYREFSDREYARIMLAMELIESPEDFYVLPMFTNSETQASIMTFCEESFGLNGKKFVKNTAKFAKFVKEKGCREDWNTYTGELMKLKVERFCDKNRIVFDCENTEG